MHKMQKKKQNKKHADGNAGLCYIFACSCTTGRGFVMFITEMFRG